jgi:hypothetical protein
MDRHYRRKGGPDVSFGEACNIAAPLPGSVRLMEPQGKRYRSSLFKETGGLPEIAEGKINLNPKCR